MQRSLRGTREGILIAVVILSAFVFFLFAVVFSFQTTLESKVMSPLVSPLIKYQVYFIISLGALGIAVGATVFYFMSQRVDSRQHAAKKSADVILRFLSPDEQHVVKALMEKQGTLLQSELSRSHGLSKVKAHRVVARLVAKGIVALQEHGKTNRISLDAEIREAMKE